MQIGQTVLHRLCTHTQRPYERWGRAQGEFQVQVTPPALWAPSPNTTDKFFLCIDSFNVGLGEGWGGVKETRNLAGLFACLSKSAYATFDRPRFTVTQLSMKRMR